MRKDVVEGFYLSRSIEPPTHLWLSFRCRGPGLTMWMGFFRKTKIAPEIPLEPALPSYSDLNESEVSWKAGHLQLLAANDVNLDDAQQIGAFYDQLLGSWLNVSEDLRPDPNDFINILGTAFGECLVRRTPLRWVVASDSYGVELAIHAEKNDFLVYPATLIAKRWVEGQPGGFIPALVDDIIVRLSEN